jgi:hypothetical protein
MNDIVINADGQLEGERPDSIPEKFWPSEGPVAATDLIANLSKSYAEAETRISTRESELTPGIEQRVREDILGAMPTSADDYTISVEKITREDGQEFEVNLSTDDPSLVELRNFAYEHKLSNNTVQGLVDMHLRAAASGIVSESDALSQIGDDAKGRAERVNQYLLTNLGEETAGELGVLNLTPAAFLGIEKLIGLAKGSGGGGIGGEGEISTNTAALQEELEKLEDSEEYWGTGPNHMQNERVRNRVMEIRDILSGGRKHSRRPDGTLA